MAECVGESAFKPMCEFSPFLVSESWVHAVGLWILEVNLLMRHVEVSAYDYRFFPSRALRYARKSSSHLIL